MRSKNIRNLKSEVEKMLEDVGEVVVLAGKNPTLGDSWSEGEVRKFTQDELMETARLLNVSMDILVFFSEVKRGQSFTPLEKREKNGTRTMGVWKKISRAKAKGGSLLSKPILEQRRLFKQDELVLLLS